MNPGNQDKKNDDAGKKEGEWDESNFPRITPGSPIRPIIPSYNHGHCYLSQNAHGPTAPHDPLAKYYGGVTSSPQSKCDNYDWRNHFSDTGILSWILPCLEVGEEQLILCMLCKQLQGGSHINGAIQMGAKAVLSQTGIDVVREETEDYISTLYKCLCAYRHCPKFKLPDDTKGRCIYHKSRWGRVRPKKLCVMKSGWSWMQR